MKHFFLRTYLLLALAGLHLALQAASYDTDLLKIFSKILPRLVIMSTQKTKVDATISLCVLHDRIDAPAAEQFSQMLTGEQTDHNTPYRIEVVRGPFASADSCRLTHLVFLFNSDSEAIGRALETVDAFSVITASYDTGLLEQGVDVSLHVGRNVVPYVNLKSLNRKGIVFDAILFRVSKVYDGGAL